MESTSDIPIEINQSSKEYKHLKHSNALITVNINRKYKETDPEYQPAKKQLNSIIASIFNRQFLENFVTIKNRAPKGSAINPNWIKEVKIHFGCELAPTTGYLHCHIVIAIAHYTIINVDQDKIYQTIANKLRDEMGIDSFYWNIKWSHAKYNDLDSMVNYVHKHDIRGYTKTTQLSDPII
jgi:hypothetical protein